MFHASKLVVASVIVAIFGGLLLAGILTQPGGDRSSVGAPATSAEPTADRTSADDAETPDVVADDRLDLLPGVDLAVEEVEPGVYRVLDDGTDHDLALQASFPDGCHPRFTVRRRRSGRLDLGR